MAQISKSNVRAGNLTEFCTALSHIHAILGSAPSCVLYSVGVHPRADGTIRCLYYKFCVANEIIINLY